MSKYKLQDLMEAYPLPEVKDKPPYKIYCDMDGVLTDFEARFEHFTGTNPKCMKRSLVLNNFGTLLIQK